MLGLPNVLIIAVSEKTNHAAVFGRDGCRLAAQVDLPVKKYITFPVLNSSGCVESSEATL